MLYLPYELLIDILKYTDSNENIIICKSSKIFFYLRSLLSIQICKIIDHDINDHDPYFIKNITFGYKFNQELNNLPQSLTHITFGNYFNQELKNLP